MSKAAALPEAQLATKRSASWVWLWSGVRWCQVVREYKSVEPYQLTDGEEFKAFDLEIVLNTSSGVTTTLRRGKKARTMMADADILSLQPKNRDFTR